MYRQNIRVQWPQFGDTVRAALMAYSGDVAEAIGKEAQKAAKQCRADIQNAAPKRSGAYAKSWAVKKALSDQRRPAYIVHAKKPGYQLAHLLERSHKIRNQYGEWGKTSPKKHIEPAAEKNSATFTRNVMRAVKNLS